MRDCNFNTDSFVTQLEHRIYLLIEDKIKVLRNHVVDNPNFPADERQLSLCRMNLKEIITMGVIHWYFPEEIQVLINLELEKKLKHFSLEDQFLISQFLNSKYEMIRFLTETRLFHTRDFFGNYINKFIPKVVKKIRFMEQKVTVKQTQRKRGYHDHGSRALDHIYIESKFVDLTREHNELEEKRQQLRDTLAFTRGWLE